MTRPKILVVDDNEMNREICNEILSAVYTVESASDREAALKIAEQLRPDLILLDIMMPGIDGYEVCRRLRQSKLRWAKVILVSAKTFVEDRLEGFRAGADDFITKPFNDDELLAKVRILLRLKHVEEVDEVKRKMLEVLQHSNRAPLATMIANAEALATMGESFSPDERKEIAKSIEKSSWRLMHWLEAGENYLSLKSGNSVPTKSETNLSTVLASLLEADEGSSALSIEIEPDVIIPCDRELATILLGELVQYAKSRHVQGQTELSLRRHGAAVRLELIYPADETSMTGFFEPFRTPQDSLLNRTNGLELAIAEEIVKLHDGRIEATRSGDQIQVSACIPVSTLDPDKQDCAATAQVTVAGCRV